MRFDPDAEADRSRAVGGQLLIELDGFLDTVEGLRDLSEIAEPVVQRFDVDQGDLFLEQLGRETILRVPEE